MEEQLPPPPPKKSASNESLLPPPPKKEGPVGSGAPSGQQGTPSPTPSAKPQTGSTFDFATGGTKEPPKKTAGIFTIPGTEKPSEDQLLESILRGQKGPTGEQQPKKPPIEKIETTEVAESTAGPKLRVPSFVKPEMPVEEFLQKTPAYISTQQEEIKAIQQNFGRRTEGKDLDRLASKITKGTPSIIEKDELNQSFIDLEDDYLDYLKATNPELGEYRENEIKTLRAKEQANNLSDAEKKRLLQFRNEAIDTKNFALEGKVWEIKEQTDIPTFQRDATPIGVQIADLKTKYNQLKLDPNGNNPPSKVAEAQKIVQEQERLFGKLQELREKTGFTEEIEKEYSDAIRSFVGDKAIEQGGIQTRFPDLAKAEEERMKKSAARYAAAQEGGVVQGLVGFTEDMVNTVGKLATNVFKAPKVIGDALGDNDYDDWDALYNSMTSLQDDREAIFGAPRALSFGKTPKYEDLPLSYRLARLGGGGIGSIAAFGFGGEFTAALGLPEFAGITGTAFITGQSDFYDEAIAAGMNPKDAARAGTAINTVVAPMEAIMGDVKFFRTPEGKSFIKSFVKGFGEGGFKQGIKQAWKSLPESAGSYLKPMLQEGVVEEGGAQVAEDIAKEIINIDSSKKYLGLWDKKDYQNAVLGGSIAAGILRTFNRPKAYSASPEQEATLGAAIDDFENITNTFTSDAFTATNTNFDVAIIEEAKEIKEGIEGSPAFNDLPKPAQDHVVAELLRKKKLEDSMKKSGIKTQDTIDEIARIDANVQDTLNNAKQIKEQYDTQNVEGVPSPVGEREGAVQTEPVEGAGAEAATPSGVLLPSDEAAQRVSDIFSDIYFNEPGGRSGGLLDEGDANAAAALARANAEGGNQYSAHGMGKSSIASAFKDLFTLLTKGVDPTRGGGRLYTAPLSGGEQGAGAGIGTATGNAYMDGPFTLVANRGIGSITDVSQIGGIIVNDGLVNARPELLDALRQAFPNIVFESTSNADALVRQLNEKAEQTTKEQISTEREIVATAEEEAAAETEFTAAVDNVRESAPDLNEDDADFAASLVQQGASVEEAVDYVKSTPESERESPEQVAEEIVPDALKDVESTAKALEGVRSAALEAPLLAEIAAGRIEEKTPNQVISEAYHKAKADGSNPELVKAVEDLLGKQEQAPTTSKVEEKAAEKVAEKPKTLKERAAEARAKAEQLRAATEGTAMVVPKLYAAALDAYASILETAENIADALKQWRQTKEYKDLNDADRTEIESEIKADLGAEYVAEKAGEEVFADIDKAIALKGPEAVSARKDFREKYGKETYDRAIEITRNFDKIVEQLENQGKIKKKCP